MEQLFQKNIDINFILLITITQLNAQKSTIKLPFEEIDFSIGRKHSGKLIDTYKEAVKIGH